MRKPLFALIALSLSIATADARKRPKMPAFQEGMAPFVGTWKHRFKIKGKKKLLYLVIKEEKGRLALRYQMPGRLEIHTSKWDGRIKIPLRVGMKEEREYSYRLTTSPLRLEALEAKKISGTGKPMKLVGDNYYELSEDGKHLTLTCRSLKNAKNNKSLPCQAPLVYEFVSRKTKWPD